MAARAMSTSEECLQAGLSAAEKEGVNAAWPLSPEFSPSPDFPGRGGEARGARLRRAGIAVAQNARRLSGFG